MRTSIDIPDALMEQLKRAASRGKTTLRRLLLDELEKSLKQRPERFELRDASVGSSAATVDAYPRLTGATPNLKDVILHGPSLEGVDLARDDSTGPNPPSPA